MANPPSNGNKKETNAAVKAKTPYKKRYAKSKAKPKSNNDKLWKSDWAKAIRAPTLAESQKELSPWDKPYPPLNNSSLGNFLTYSALSRYTLTTDTTQTKVFVFQPSSRGLFTTGEWKADGTYTSGSSGAGPTKRFFSDTDQPTNIRILRSGLRICNISSNDSTQGLVRVYQGSSAIDYQFQSASSDNITSTFANELVAIVDKNPKSKEYSAHQMQTQQEFVIAPCNFSSYNSYGKHPTYTDSTAQYQLDLKAPLDDMPMNVLILTFPPTTVAQSYSISMMSQLALRYPANQILSEISKPAVTGNENRTKKHHENVAKIGALSREAVLTGGFYPSGVWDGGGPI